MKGAELGESGLKLEGPKIKGSKVFTVFLTIREPQESWVHVVRTELMVSQGAVESLE